MKPRKVIVGDVRARPIRGPKGDLWYWRAVLYRDRREHPVWSGWATRDEAIEQLSQLVLGGDPTRRDEPDTTVETVRDLLRCWTASQADRPDLAPRTVQVYRCRRRALEHTIGDVRVHRVSLRTLERHRRLRASVSPVTVRHELRVLRIAWLWAIEMGIVDAPLPKMRVAGGPTREKVTPTHEEVRRVLACMPDRTRLVVLLLYATGARVSEVTALKWGDIDLEHRRVRIFGKGRRHRVVYLPSSVVAELVERGVGEPLDPVCGFASAATGTRRATSHLRRACEEAGVRPFPPGGLRRLAEDTLQRRGVDIGTIGAMLGHSPLVALQHYRQPTDGDLRDAASRAGLGELVETNVIHLHNKPAQLSD